MGRPRVLQTIEFVWATALALLFATGCSSENVSSASGASLLAGARPVSAHGVSEAHRLTDGVIAVTGDDWKSDLTTLLRGEAATINYDLQTERSIRAAWLMGDNNDSYILEGSSDGKNYSPIWEARSVSDAGLQPREVTNLNQRARFLRLRATGGDGRFSLAELQVFETAPEALPADVRTARGIELGANVRGRMLNAAGALILLLVLCYRGAPRWLQLISGVIVIGAGVELAQSLTEAWPLEQRDVSLARFAIAVVAFVALLREQVGGRFPAWRPIVLSVLGAMGVLGVLAFYNMGHPQFYDRTSGDNTFVHHLDLKQYYATAKYFPEIGYRGIYEADMAAYIEDTGITLDQLAPKPIRSLHTHGMSTVGQERARIEKVKERFSPERWAEYKQDAKYFRDTMGMKRYFSTFYDLGGNATPVWIAMGYGLFNLFQASDAAFFMTGLLDPLLLLTAFLAIGLTFGPRTAFFCMAIFGANDFIMYGSNWAGATLRHDWMAYLAFGACALKRKRWVLAGALLAMSTSIRAFPALSLIAASIPALWWVGETLVRERRPPQLKDLLEEHGNLLRVALGAVVTASVLLVLTSALLGPSAWSDWALKVSQLSADPHGNHIALRGLLAGSGGDQRAIVQDRIVLHVSAILMFAGLVFVAARRMQLEQAAILGLVMTPVLFYPANYYIHLIWLLPMIAVERRSASPVIDARGAWLVGTLLLLCAAQYFTTLETDRPLHFYFATVLLFASLAFILCVLVQPQVSAWLALPANDANPRPSNATPKAPTIAAKDPEAPAADTDDDLESQRIPAQ